MPPARVRLMPKNFSPFQLTKTIKVKPAGKYGFGSAGGKVPKGARVFLYNSGHGTTPFYLYIRRYPKLGKKPFVVVDLRRLPRLPAARVEAIIEGLGLLKAAAEERLIVKTPTEHRAGEVYKRYHAPGKEIHGQMVD